jgi:hypothetical protein
MAATKRVVSISRSYGFICGLILLASAGQVQFRAGAARHEITPTEPGPMWGYGDRHDALSTGILDPLHADALVLECAGKKLAIVSLDLGRAPAERSRPLPCWPAPSLNWPRISSSSMPFPTA